jgi:hypothetical protein
MNAALIAARAKLSKKKRGVARAVAESGRGARSSA